MRHTFASELLNAGMRLECLQPLLGHTSIEVTRRYARLTDRTRKTEEGITKAETRFADAIARLRPVADILLRTFQEMSAPEEVALEFGIKFNAKAGAVFASIDSEATFKVSVKWKAGK